MDWLIQLVQNFEDMPTEKAAMLILFVALLVIAGSLVVMSRRDKATADVDKNQTASVVDLSLAIRSLAEGMPPIVEAFRGLLASMQQQEQRNQERFEATRTVMGAASERRDKQIAAIQVGVAAIPAGVEVGMSSLEERVTARLDQFEARLNEKIAKLPHDLIQAFQNAMKQTKQEILSEIKDGNDGKRDELVTIGASGHLPAVGDQDSDHSAGNGGGDRAHPGGSAEGGVG